MVTESGVAVPEKATRSTLPAALPCLLPCLSSLLPRPFLHAALFAVLLLSSIQPAAVAVAATAAFHVDMASPAAAAAAAAMVVRHLVPVVVAAV